MKQVWKRTMSLALSGVLLLSNVPVQAWATEEPAVQEIPAAVAQLANEIPAELQINGNPYAENAVENVSFANGVLTLNGTTKLTSIQAAGMSLTIELIGNNEIQAGDAVAITVDRDLTIKGDGSLKVTTSNATAVSVAGSGEGDNLKGLIIDKARLWIDVTAAENPVGIVSSNGIAIRGSAHIKTNHTADGSVYTLPAGYVNGVLKESESTWTADGSALEFVSAEHLSETFNAYDNTNHFKSCADETCPLNDGVRIDPKEHDLKYSEEGSAITAVCKDCDATESITLKAESKVGNGTDAVKASYEEPTGILSGEKPTITYNNEAGDKVAEPTAQGKYTAFMELGEKTASVDFYIQKDIKTEEIKAVGYLVYNGKEQEQKVEVTDIAPGNYTVDGSKNTAAGTYTLTVKGTNYYGGEVSLGYSIAKAEPKLKADIHQQTVAEGICDFAEPVFLGVDDKELAGTLKYRYNEEELGYSELKKKLAAGFEGEQEVHYTFTPEDKVNYEDVKSEEPIKVTAKKVDFRLANGNITDQDVLSADLVYGVEAPVKTDAIKAFVEDDRKTPDNEYTVTYTKNGAEVKERPLPVDTYSFEITYTGTVDGVYCKDYPVYKGTGTFAITAKPMTLKAEPKGLVLVVEKNEDETLKKQNLLDAIEVTDPASDVTIEYSTDNVNWSETIPQGDEIGRYDVHYCISADNYEQKTGSVITMIQPELTAVYGQSLADVELPDDGKWKWVQNEGPIPVDKLADIPVGNYGPNEFQMVYEDSTPFKVTVTVSAKPVEEPIIEVATYIHYDERNPVAVKVYDPMDPDKNDDNVEIAAEEYLAKVNEIDSRTGWTTVTVKDNKEDGNYEITAVTKNVFLYRPGHIAFTALQTDDDLKKTDYNTVDKVKEALSSEIEAELYPEDNMKYFKIMMTYDNTPQDGKENWIATRDLDYYPVGGFTYKIPYSAIGTGVDKDTNFKLSIMDAATSDILDTKAGTSAVEITDFERTDDGIEFHSDGYAIVCVATEVDKDKPYAIDKAFVYDNKTTETSNIGSLTISVDSKETDTATYGKTVTVTAKKSSGYSIEKVTVTKKSDGETVAVEQSSSTYKFKMPASDVTVTMKLKKTTSTTKNANTGDTSNIQLWVTMLAASGVAIVAVVLFWLKKRKK